MIKLRELKLDDSDVIFSWIKNPELRKMTGTRGEPTYEGHQNWMRCKINDKNNVIRVITYQDVPVGIIGTNEINLHDNNTNIYIYIGNLEYRKKKIASHAIEQFISFLVDKYNCHKITASIRSYNIPSINLFMKNGFVCEGVQRDQIVYDGVYYDRMLFGKIVK